MTWAAVYPTAKGGLRKNSATIQSALWPVKKIAKIYASLHAQPKHPVVKQGRWGTCGRLCCHHHSVLHGVDLREMCPSKADKSSSRKA